MYKMPFLQDLLEKIHKCNRKNFLTNEMLVHQKKDIGKIVMM